MKESIMSIVTQSTTTTLTTPKIKKLAPAQLVACSKLPRVEKMAIFNGRIYKILRFLIEENYSSLENLAKLIDTPKQTALRITKHLCDKQYLTKVEVDTGSTRCISIFQPTNTGIMFAVKENEPMPVLRELPKGNLVTLCHDLQLQKVRLNLEQQGYTNFKNSWQLTQIARKYGEKILIVPDYACVDPQGNKVAIEYERTIKTTKRYQTIIGYYLESQKLGTIDKVLYFTDKGFANKLKQLFCRIDQVFQCDKIRECSSERLRFFEFSEI